MTQLPLQFPKADSLIQLTLGTLRQIPVERLEREVATMRDQIKMETGEKFSYLLRKQEVVMLLLELKKATAALDEHLGFDPKKYEVQE